MQLRLPRPRGNRTPASESSQQTSLELYLLSRGYFMEKLPERKRFTLELDGEILCEIDGIRKSLGLRAYGATINILLK